MNNHYFTDNRHLSENRKELSFRFWCFHLDFMTDNGVFSKTAVDFGTRILLETLLKYKEELQDQILDVGCGYGPIGICMKKIRPEAKVDMIDVNPRAVLLAKENASKNDVDVTVFESHCYEHVKKSDYSDIITNPPIRAGKKVIYEIFLGAYDHLRKDGNLWVVIRKAQGAESAKRYIEEIFGNCTIVEKKKGYFILKAKKILTI